MKTLIEKLGALLSTGTSTQADALFEARALLESELSHDEKRDAVYRALERSGNTPDGSYFYRYIADVYDNDFIYEQREAGVEKLFKRAYSIDGAGDALLGQATEVRREVTYVPIGEAQPGAVVEAAQNAAGVKPLREAFISLRERSINDAGVMRIKAISPGWGSSGYYSREVLERDFKSAFPKGTLMFADHATPAQEAEQPEGKTFNTVGAFVSDPVYEVAGVDGEGAYVDVEVFTDYREAIDTRAPYIGVSINGGGDYHIGEADGKSGPIIDAITVGKSVDVVTRAGRGGKILSLQESLRQNPAGAPPAMTQPTQENNNSMNEQEAIALRETNTKLETRAARLEERDIARDARDMAASHVAGVEMPQLTRERLAESLSHNPPVKASDEGRELDRDAFKTVIEKAVDSEIKYLAAVTESGAVRGMGAAATTAKKTEGKSLNESAGLAGARANLGL